MIELGWFHLLIGGNQKAFINRNWWIHAINEEWMNNEFWINSLAAANNPILVIWWLVVWFRFQLLNELNGLKTFNPVNEFKQINRKSNQTNQSNFIITVFWMKLERFNQEINSIKTIHSGLAREWIDWIYWLNPASFVFN